MITDSTRLCARRRSINRTKHDCLCIYAVVAIADHGGLLSGFPSGDDCIMFRHRTAAVFRRESRPTSDPLISELPNVHSYGHLDALNEPLKSPTHRCCTYNMPVHRISALAEEIMLFLMSATACTLGCKDIFELHHINQIASYYEINIARRPSKLP